MRSLDQAAKGFSFLQARYVAPLMLQLESWARVVVCVCGDDSSHQPVVMAPWTERDRPVRASLENLVEPRDCMSPSLGICVMSFSTLEADVNGCCKPSPAMWLTSTRCADLLWEEALPLL